MLITTKIFCSDCNFYTFGGRIQGKGLNSFSHILNKKLDPRYQNEVNKMTHTQSISICRQ